MADIHGMPMIGHCYSRVRMSSVLDDTYVATCDQEIYDYIKSIDGKVVMTSNSHERASDRAAEAMVHIEKEIGGKTDILVMVQGDEPMDTPEMVSEAVEPLIHDENIQVVNLMGRIDDISEFEDHNTVKVVANLDGNAIYFSREPIPSMKKGWTKVPMFKQICIIPFRREFLLRFNELPQTPLEKIESVDMLRVIENGGVVKMVTTSSPSFGVDTPEDLEKAKQLMSDDVLMGRYLF